MTLPALALALWLAIAEQYEGLAVEIEKRSPAVAHALRWHAEQLRRSHAGR